MCEQRIILVCYVGANIGLGHLSRLLALADVLRIEGKVQPEFLIFGESIKIKELSNFKTHTFLLSDDFIDVINNILETNNYSAIVLDLFPNHNIQNLA